MVVGFTSTYAISAYHHWCCEFESPSGWGVQHYVINFVSDLRQNKQNKTNTAVICHYVMFNCVCCGTPFDALSVVNYGWLLIEEIPLNKIFFLLNANSELLAEIGDFIKQSTELQQWGSCRSKVWHVKNIILINRVYFVYPILWSNCNFLCFVCLYLYLLDPHGCIIMQIKNYIVNMFVMIVEVVVFISVISCRLVLLVEERRVPRENHRPATSQWQCCIEYTPHELVSSSQI